MQFEVFTLSELALDRLAAAILEAHFAGSAEGAPDRTGRQAEQNTSQ
ncbi:MAG: hypothetical protein JO057_04835 [Chloroflexi bacterium]|nr:hypothetical protein [Chloroflexota bacterium]